MQFVVFFPHPLLSHQHSWCKLCELEQLPALFTNKHALPAKCSQLDRLLSLLQNWLLPPQKPPSKLSPQPFLAHTGRFATSAEVKHPTEHAWNSTFDMWASSIAVLGKRQNNDLILYSGLGFICLQCSK